MDSNVPINIDSNENLNFFFKEKYDQRIIETVIKRKNTLRLKKNSNTTVQEFICVNRDRFGKAKTYNDIKYLFEIIFYNTYLDTLYEPRNMQGQNVVATIANVCKDFPNRIQIMAAFIETLIDTYVIDDNGVVDTEEAKKVFKMFYIADLGPKENKFSGHQNMVFLGYPIIPYIPYATGQKYLNDRTYLVLKNNFTPFDQRVKNDKPFYKPEYGWSSYPLYQLTTELLDSVGPRQLQYETIKKLYSDVYSTYVIEDLKTDKKDLQKLSFLRDSINLPQRKVSVDLKSTSRPDGSTNEACKKISEINGYENHIQSPYFSPDQKVKIIFDRDVVNKEFNELLKKLPDENAIREYLRKHNSPTEIVYSHLNVEREQRLFSYTVKDRDNYFVLGFKVPFCLNMTVPAAFLYFGISLKYISDWFRDDKKAMELFHVYQNPSIVQENTNKRITIDENLDLPFFWSLRIQHKKEITYVELENIIFLMSRIRMLEQNGQHSFQKFPLFDVFQRTFNRNNKPVIDMKPAPQPTATVNDFRTYLYDWTRLDNTNNALRHGCTFAFTAQLLAEYRVNDVSLFNLVSDPYNESRLGSVLNSTSECIAEAFSKATTVKRAKMEFTFDDIIKVFHFPLK